MIKYIFGSVLSKHKTVMIFFFKFVGKLFKFVLMVTGILSFTRCSSGYKKDGNKVLFDGKEVSPSLQVLNKVFAKDDSTAWFKRYSIPDADIASFTAVDENYAKDKNTVFYCDEYREGQNYYLTKKSKIKKKEAPILRLLQAWAVAMPKTTGRAILKAMDST